MDLKLWSLNLMLNGNKWMAVFMYRPPSIKLDKLKMLLCMFLMFVKKKVKLIYSWRLKCKFSE